MQRRRIEWAECRDGKVVIRARGIFGGSGVCHLTLRDEDVRRSAPRAGSPEAAAVVLRSQRWTYISNIQGRDKRKERFYRKELRNMGKGGKLKITFADDVPPLKSEEAILKLEEGLIEDYKQLDEKSIEIIVSWDRFMASGKREGNTLLQRRAVLHAAIVAAYCAVGISVEFKQVDYSEQKS